MFIWILIFTANSFIEYQHGLTCLNKTNITTFTTSDFLCKKHCKDHGENFAIYDYDHEICDCSNDCSNMTASLRTSIWKKFEKPKEFFFVYPECLSKRTHVYWARDAGLALSNQMNITLRSPTENVSLPFEVKNSESRYQDFAIEVFHLLPITHISSQTHEMFLSYYKDDIIVDRFIQDIELCDNIRDDINFLGQNVKCEETVYSAHVESISDCVEICNEKEWPFMIWNKPSTVCECSSKCKPIRFEGSSLFSLGEDDEIELFFQHSHQTVLSWFADTIDYVAWSLLDSISAKANKDLNLWETIYDYIQKYFGRKTLTPSFMPTVPHPTFEPSKLPTFEPSFSRTPSQPFRAVDQSNVTNSATRQFQPRRKRDTIQRFPQEMEKETDRIILFAIPVALGLIIISILAFHGWCHLEKEKMKHQISGANTSRRDSLLLEVEEYLV